MLTRHFLVSVVCAGLGFVDLSAAQSQIVTVRIAAIVEPAGFERSGGK